MLTSFWEVIVDVVYYASDGKTSVDSIAGLSSLKAHRSDGRCWSGRSLPSRVFLGDRVHSQNPWFIPY